MCVCVKRAGGEYMSKNVKKEAWSKTLSFPIETIANIESIRQMVNSTSGKALADMQDTIIYCVNRVYQEEFWSNREQKFLKPEPKLSKI